MKHKLEKRKKLQQGANWGIKKQKQNKLTNMVRKRKKEERKNENLNRGR